MSRRIHRAELAVTTTGAVLLNVVTIDGALDLAELLKLAVSQRGGCSSGLFLGRPRSGGSFVTSGLSCQT